MLGNRSFAGGACVPSKCDAPILLTGQYVISGCAQEHNMEKHVFLCQDLLLLMIPRKHLCWALTQIMGAIHPDTMDSHTCVLLLALVR